MANFRLTYIFNDGRAGWSETFFWTGSNHDAAMAAALPVGTARIGLLANTVQLEAIRVSDEAILGDSAFDQSLDGTNIATAVATAKDVTQVAVLGRGSSQNKYRRQIWLRGLPDNWVYFDPKTGKSQLNASAGFIAAWNTWSAQVLTKAFQLRVLNKDLPMKVITDVRISSADGYTAINCPQHGYVPGQMVRIRGCKFDNPQSDIVDDAGRNRVNGVWQVRAMKNLPPPAEQFNAADWFEIPSTFIDTTPVYIAGGKVQAREYIYATIDKLTYERFAKRDTGRAFFVSRGRSKGKKVYSR